MLKTKPSKVDLSDLPLGIGPLNLGVTISFSDNMIVKMASIPCKKGLHWDCLTPAQQKRYMTDYIEEVYVPLFDKIEGHFEFNKAGMIHAHLNGIILLPGADKDMSERFWLQHTRAKVLQNPVVFKLFNKRINTIRIANYIHRLEDPAAWLEYIRKDGDKMMFKPLFM